MKVRAFTLMETILSLVIVTLISLAIAAILQAAVYGTSSQRDARRVAVRGQVVHARLDDNIRNARAVLAASSNYLVLWTGDSNPDGHVNLSEIELIELPANSTTLNFYTGRFATGDPSYAATSNFASIAQSLKSNANFLLTMWVIDVSSLVFALDSSTPMLAKLVRWKLTLTDKQMTSTVASGSALGAWGQPR